MANGGEYNGNWNGGGGNGGGGSNNWNGNGGGGNWNGGGGRGDNENEGGGYGNNGGGHRGNWNNGSVIGTTTMVIGTLMATTEDEITMAVVMEGEVVTGGGRHVATIATNLAISARNATRHVRTKVEGMETTVEEAVIGTAIEATVGMTITGMETEETREMAEAGMEETGVMEMEVTEEVTDNRTMQQVAQIRLSKQ
ncbi:hypothetical protein CBR_g24444 [Chara braunii]|uniref:Uncharacterized protein n=1 Tax=Chara braunii TaxID=69332 RepID=A0A388JMU5_CHABU|nr:hypothetical protein CBR_g24444 [Chara braunii]|eukprot:GBG59101.1 hypothetical protein CBR_g24444 [Chara braunii]